MVALKMKMPGKCGDCRFAQAQGEIWFWCAAVAPVLPEMTVAKKFS